MNNQVFPFCKAIIEHNADLLAAISTFDNDTVFYRDGNFYFSIPGLYQFLCDHQALLKDKALVNMNLVDATLGETVAVSDASHRSYKVSYQEFRSGLFKGTLNQSLTTLGYKIGIHSSTGKVDTNTYVLTSL